MKKLNNCPICKNKKINFELKNYDKNFHNKKDFSVDKCENCSCLFLNPQLEMNELGKYYPKEGYYSLKGISKGFKTNLKIELYKTYFSESKNFLKKLIFCPIKFLARGVIVKPNLKLLDIGSGVGQFLYEMKSLGLNVEGLEPGEFNEKESKKEGIKITKSLLENSKYKKESFDLITLNHVLEHVNNPSEVLEKIHSLLKKDGTFIVGVPNSNSLAYKIFKKDWYQLDIPRHLINYSSENLTTLLKTKGFKIEKVRYNSRPSQFTISLYYKLGIKKPNKLMNLILNLLFLIPTWIVNLTKSGDQIEVWCKK